MPRYIPSCELGYTNKDLQEILGDRLPEFHKWMHGQTVAICDGRQYNHDKGEYEDTSCGPHGVIYYSWDVSRFMAGKPIID